MFLSDCRSEPSETWSRHSVSTNTLCLAEDKHLVARLCCHATLYLFVIFFLSHVMPSLLSLALPKPHLVFFCFLTFCSSSRKAHILHIPHNDLKQKAIYIFKYLECGCWWFVFFIIVSLLYIVCMSEVDVERG